MKTENVLNGGAPPPTLLGNDKLAVASQSDIWLPHSISTVVHNKFLHLNNSRAE